MFKLLFLSCLCLKVFLSIDANRFIQTLHIKALKYILKPMLNPCSFARSFVLSFNLFFFHSCHTHIVSEWRRERQQFKKDLIIFFSNFQSFFPFQIMTQESRSYFEAKTIFHLSSTSCNVRKKSKYMCVVSYEILYLWYVTYG